MRVLWPLVSLGLLFERQKVDSPDRIAGNNAVYIDHLPPVAGEHRAYLPSLQTNDLNFSRKPSLENKAILLVNMDCAHSPSDIARTTEPVSVGVAEQILFRPE